MDLTAVWRENHGSPDALAHCIFRDMEQAAIGQDGLRLNGTLAAGGINV